MTAAALLKKKSGPSGFKSDGNPDHSKYGGKEEEKKGAAKTIEESFCDGLPSPASSGAEDKEVTVHDILEVGSGDLVAYEISA
jgi:hypothetical protein